MLIDQRVKGTVVLLPNIEKNHVDFPLIRLDKCDAFQEDHLNWMFRSHPKKICNILLMWVKNAVNNPPVITIFIGGMVPIPCHGWCMALFYPHHMCCKLCFDLFRENPVDESPNRRPAQAPDTERPRRHLCDPQRLRRNRRTNSQQQGIDSTSLSNQHI